MNTSKKIVLLLFFIATIFYVIGCSNSSTPVTPVVTTITVSGKVLDAYGYPISPVAKVLIGTQNTTTAADGSFTINNVSTPYDVYVMSVNGVFGVKGLTINNPYLPGATTVTSIGALSVTIPAVPAGSKATVIFQDTVSGRLSGFGQITAGQTISSINMGGTNGQHVAGKLYLLQYTINGGVVGTYTGYAEQSVSFNYGANPNYTFTTLSGGLGTSTVSGTVNGSGGTTLEAQLNINFGSKNNISHRGGFIQSIVVTGNSTAFSFNVPTNTTTPALINLLAINSAPVFARRMKTLSAGTTGAVINVDSIPVLTTPPTGAANVDTTTTFSFTNGSGNGVHVVGLTPTGPSGNFFQIITKGTSFTLPNLSAFGYSLGTTAPYSWTQIKPMDINSTDDLSSQFFDLNPALLGTTNSSVFTFTSK